MPEHWLAKAEENIGAATMCLENGFYNASVNRCYYAMFQVAIAALLEFRSALSEVMTKRRIADYTANMVGPKVAQRALRKAESFVERVKEAIK